MRRSDEKKNKQKKAGWIAAAAVLLLLIAAAAWYVTEGRDAASGSQTEKATDQTAEPETRPDGEGEDREKPAEDGPDSFRGVADYDDDRELPDEPTYIDGILIVNKKYPLPADFAPGEDPEARAAMDAMAAAAEKDGIRLFAFSTFRTFERQKELYDGYVARDGVEEADRYSARPGYSEHQTGLTFDIGEAGAEEHWANSSFADTEAGRWLSENAHRFGFILRYPEGKESITGYMYEAWHYRYVGKEAAERIHAQGLTLEEYLLD